MIKYLLRDQISAIENWLIGRDVKALDDELAALVLALEDKRFWYHFGVDPLALTRAVYRYLAGRPNGGASTIDMQFVRTITRDYERTMLRKFKEMYLAILLRHKLGPSRMLAHYLSCAYTGAGLYGMDHAASAMFGLPISELDRRQKAMLAATLLSPMPKQPTLAWWAKIVRRANCADQRAFGNQ